MVVGVGEDFFGASDKVLFPFGQVIGGFIVFGNLHLVVVDEGDFAGSFVEERRAFRGLGFEAGDYIVKFYMDRHSKVSPSEYPARAGGFGRGTPFCGVLYRRPENRKRKIWINSETVG